MKTHTIRCKICDSLFSSVFENGESIDEETCDACWEEIAGVLPNNGEADELDDIFLPLEGQDYIEEEPEDDEEEEY